MGKSSISKFLIIFTKLAFGLAAIATTIGVLVTIYAYILGNSFAGKDSSFLQYLSSNTEVILFFIITSVAAFGLKNNKKFGVVVGRVGIFCLLSGVLYQPLLNAINDLGITKDEYLIIIVTILVFSLCSWGLEIIRKKINLPVIQDYGISLIGASVVILVAHYF